MPVLDRRVPSDWKHVEKHPLLLSVPPVITVEKVLNVPRQYRFDYDQGQEGACVGFSESWLMSILNRKLYDARRLYHEAQLVDEYDDTPPADGTSVRAGFDVLRNKGHWRVWSGSTRTVELDEGISSNKWAQNVDDVRQCISLGMPVVFGINWYDSFFGPQSIRRDHNRMDYWIGRQTDWGQIAGGHAICCVAASDARQALGLCNTWGTSYPFIVWISYTSAMRLLAEDGEAGIVVDRVSA